MKLFKKHRNKNKTCILLDIDGALNSYTKLDEPTNIIPHTWGRWHVSNANISFLVQLAYLKNVDVYWTSTWGNESNELNDYLDIPKFKVLFHKSKQDAVDAALSLQYCRYILIDDEYADSRIKHIIQPNSDLGLVEIERQYILGIIT